MITLIVHYLIFYIFCTILYSSFTAIFSSWVEFTDPLRNTKQNPLLRCIYISFHLKETWEYLQHGLDPISYQVMPAYSSHNYSLIFWRICRTYSVSLCLSIHTYQSMWFHHTRHTRVLVGRLSNIYAFQDVLANKTLEFYVKWLWIWIWKVVTAVWV